MASSLLQVPRSLGSTQTPTLGMSVCAFFVLLVILVASHGRVMLPRLRTGTHATSGDLAPLRQSIQIGLHFSLTSADSTRATRMPTAPASGKVQPATVCIRLRVSALLVGRPPSCSMLHNLLHPLHPLTTTKRSMRFDLASWIATMRCS